MSEKYKDRYIELAKKWAECSQSEEYDWLGDELDWIWYQQLTDQDRTEITQGNWKQNGQ